MYAVQEIMRNQNSKFEIITSNGTLADDPTSTKDPLNPFFFIKPDPEVKTIQVTNNHSLTWKTIQTNPEINELIRQINT